MLSCRKRRLNQNDNLLVRNMFTQIELSLFDPRVCRIVIVIVCHCLSFDIKQKGRKEGGKYYKYQEAPVNPDFILASQPTRGHEILTNHLICQLSITSLFLSHPLRKDATTNVTHIIKLEKKT